MSIQLNEWPSSFEGSGNPNLNMAKLTAVISLDDSQYTLYPGNKWGRQGWDVGHLAGINRPGSTSDVTAHMHTYIAKRN